MIWSQHGCFGCSEDLSRGGQDSRSCCDYRFLFFCYYFSYHPLNVLIGAVIAFFFFFFFLSYLLLLIAIPSYFEWMNGWMDGQRSIHEEIENKVDDDGGRSIFWFQIYRWSPRRHEIAVSGHISRHFDMIPYDGASSDLVASLKSSAI